MPQRTVVAPSRRPTQTTAPRAFVRRALRAPRWAQRQRSTHDQGVEISVVIPVFNERDNLAPLAERLTRTLMETGRSYELLFIDDHSEDRSVEVLETLRADPRVRVLAKEGARGKASSLLQAFAQANGSIIAMIDADLQYPPELLPSMLDALAEHDIVVANRRRRRTSTFRSVLSRTYQYVFGRLLLSLTVDVQSGLKAFRADVLGHVSLHPSPWGFDYEFLYRATRAGFRTTQVDFTFEKRTYGQSHVRPFATGLELMLGSLLLRLRFVPQDLFPFLFYPHASEHHVPVRNAGDYLFLPEIHSVRRHMYVETVSFVLFAAAAAAGLVRGASALTGFPPLLILSATFSFLYACLIVFKSRIVLSSLQEKPLTSSRKQLAAIRDEDLPMYTIIIPLYQEADVIPQIVQAMSRIDYPVDKLEIIITLEEYDLETRNAILQAAPPPHFKTLILPDVQPKTKPKALNVAFPHVRGEFVVIYDAEIIPDADQLKKAYLAFRDHPHVACLQTQLDHYNAEQNWITKLFNAEFSFHYDLFLPGLQRRGYALPLSGHSTHFRRDVLEEIGAWDPYNLTEDCDIGIRLFRRGYRTDVIDSGSTEEATSSLRSWIAQRSRWMKGFIQTSIVHLRHPLRLKDELGGWTKFLGFLVIVPGSVVMNIVNLFYWFLLGVWLLTHSLSIQALFPAPVLYMSIFSFAVGNFLFMYLNLVGLYQRKRYGLVKYGLLSFLYWLMLGYAAVRACVHLVLKPHHWEKTEHGKHLALPDYVAPALARS